MLEIKNLSLKKRLKPVSFYIKKGTSTALIGPNGSGKSTILHILIGSLSPTTGNIFWNRKEISSYTRRERSQLMTLVPQNPTFAFPFTVEEIVAMGQYAKKMTTRITKNIDALLEKLNLTKLRKKSITEISQGERQRVLIARGIASGCPIFLMDEPTANLDPYYKAETWELIRYLQKEGITVIIATHDIEEVEEYTDHIIGLKGNALDFSGSWDKKRILSLFGAS